MAKRYDAIENFKYALFLCKGRFQRNWLQGYDNVSKLRGKAARWELSYIRSRANLIKRIEERGIPHRIVLGPKGGRKSMSVEILAGACK
jgi:hypothetical protein